MSQQSKPQLLNTIVGTQLLLSVYMAQVNFPTLDSMAEKSILYTQRQRQNRQFYMAQIQLLTRLFFKIPKFSAHRFRAWRHSHSYPISYLGFIMTIVIVISSEPEFKLYPMYVPLN